MAFSSQPGFDITPFIPRRTSSTAHFIPQLIESLNPPIIRTSNDRRDPVPIQVTSDADMFCRLWIKYFNNPIMIKRAILQKLNILADYPYFEFTHENGPYSDKALTDDELLYICQTSSNTNTNRILVRPISINSTYIESPFSDVPISPFSAGVPTPPITETRPIFNETTKISCSDFVQQQQQTTSLWAVAPKKPSTDSSSSSTKGIALYDPPPQKIPQKIVEEDPPSSPSVSQKSSISLSDGETSNEEDMFGERPSVDKLFRDIDRYLPGHDLDQPQPAISKRVGLGHRPSVRVVAKDAHRRWKQATNVIRINQMLRRKSTKMWGVKVERVKPGEEIISPHPNYGDMPETTKMKWMRGELIGKGSFGRVYHAFNTTTGDWLAVKQVDTAITQADKRNKDLQEAVNALHREILLLKDLDHENIVQYIGYDSDVAEGHIYIFLEYVPGGSISSLMSQFKPFDEDLTSFFTRQILEGLTYLHHRHILHRDIKSGNVLIDTNGVCKIADFGLSKNQNNSAYDPHSDNSRMKGSVYWMAPEVLTENYGAKIDIWSLGCTVLEMLTGAHPWKDLPILAALYKLGTNNSPDIPDNISDDAKDFLDKCFIINPDDRPTADELLQHPFVKENPSFDFKDSIKEHRNRRAEIVDEPTPLVEEEHEEIYKSHIRPTRRRHFEDEVKVTFAEHPQIAQTTSETDLESDYPSELASSENDSIKTTEAESTPLLKVHSEIGELEIPAIHHI